MFPRAGPLFFGAQNGDLLEQYLIEIENISGGLVVLTCPAKSPLMLTAPRGGERAQRVALTSEQFLSMAYDLEGFAEGKHGVARKLALWVTDRVSGASEQCPFDVVHMVASGGFSADTAAADAQAKQEAEIVAATAAVNKKAQDALAASGSGDLADSVQAGMNALS